MNNTEPRLRRVLREYGIQGNVVFRPLGGTTASSVYIKALGEEYVLRRRPADFSQSSYIDYDHSLIDHLVKREFPVCPMVRTTSGRTWIESDRETYELVRYLPGGTIMEPNEDQLHQCGRLLATLHELGRDFLHAGKSSFVREDHFDILRPLLEELQRLADSGSQREQVARLTDLAASTSRLLDRELSSQLETSVIHGDFHQGNILFHEGKLSALLDLYYAGKGFTLRDIGDGIMFVASRRETLLDTDDIRSLTQAWRPDTVKMAAFLGGYSSVRAIPQGLEHLKRLMISRWIQCRVRGARKVAEEEKLEFVFDNLWEIVQMLEKEIDASLAAAMGNL